MKIILVALLLAFVVAYKLHKLPRTKHKQNYLSAAEFEKSQVLHSPNNYQIMADSRVVTTLNVPDVFQATDYTCGPSSLTAVLNYFHIDQR